VAAAAAAADGERRAAAGLQCNASSQSAGGQRLVPATTSVCVGTIITQQTKAMGSECIPADCFGRRPPGTVGPAEKASAAAATNTQQSRQGDCSESQGMHNDTRAVRSIRMSDNTASAYFFSVSRLSFRPCQSKFTVAHDVGKGILFEIELCLCCFSVCNFIGWCARASDWAWLSPSGSAAHADRSSALPPADSNAPPCTLVAVLCVHRGEGGGRGWATTVPAAPSAPEADQ